MCGRARAAARREGEETPKLSLLQPCDLIQGHHRPNPRSEKAKEIHLKGSARRGPEQSEEGWEMDGNQPRRMQTPQTQEAPL